MAQNYDQLLSQLLQIEERIRELEVGVEDFKGPHFDRHFRAMQGLSVKLLTDLDCLQLSSNGREILRQKRRLAIHKIENLAIALESKAHKGGSCDNCEVREMEL